MLLGMISKSSFGGSGFLVAFIFHVKKCLESCWIPAKKLNLRNGKRAACNHGVMDARGRLLSTKEA